MRRHLDLVLIVSGILAMFLMVAGPSQVIPNFGARGTLTVAGILLALLAFIAFRLATRSD